MTTIPFETDLKINGTPVHANFAGKFEINHYGEIDEIALDAWEGRRYSGTKYIDGPLFDILKLQLTTEYDDAIEDALDDMRSSRAADHADRRNDQHWSSF